MIDNVKTFKDFLKERFFWCLPNGTFVSVPPFGHTQYIEKHPDLFNISKEEMWKKYSPYTQALKNGAIRIGIFNISPHGLTADLNYWDINILKQHAYNLYKFLQPIEIESVCLMPSNQSSMTRRYIDFKKLRTI